MPGICTVRRPPAKPRGKDVGRSSRAVASRNDRVALYGSDRRLAREMTLQLKHFGYRLECVDRVEGLVASVEAGGRAVLLDVHCESGSGLGLGGEAQDVVARLPAPLVFLSSRDDIDARLAAVRMGAVAYLLKPLDYALLVDTLDQVTGRRYPEPYRVLLVESDAEQAKSYEAVMTAAGIKVVVVEAPMRTLEIMADFNPELVLLELNLPGLSGIELASVIRQKQTYLSVPIVFLSEETRAERQIEAMERADNFLTKPIAPAYLASAVRSRAERYRMLRALMTRDSLTGLLNHTNSKERLATEVRRAVRLGTNLVLAMIDIDRFKQVNDTRGHQAGDRVIKRLARLLQQRLRQTDIIGRYGGDEFVVVMVDTTLDGARAVIEQVRGDFASLGHGTAAGRFGVTFSAGLATLAEYPECGLLLEAADQALYRAKHQGGNRVIAASGPPRGDRVEAAASSSG